MGGCSQLMSRWSWWRGAHSCRGACWMAGEVVAEIPKILDNFVLNMASHGIPHLMV